MCDAPSCHRGGNYQCSECRKWYCAVHCTSRLFSSNTCHNCQGYDVSECNVPDCHSKPGRQCTDCNRRFCDDHVRGVPGMQCVCCMDSDKWYKIEHDGTCGADGCLRMKEHSCEKCGNVLCGEHAHWYESGLPRASYVCGGCRK